MTYFTTEALPILVAFELDSSICDSLTSAISAVLDNDYIYTCLQSVFPDDTNTVNHIRHQITHNYFAPELKAIISICYYIGCYSTHDQQKDQCLVASASTIGLNYCNLFFAFSPLRNEKYTPLSYSSNNINSWSSSSNSNRNTHTFGFPLYYKWLLLYTLSGYVYDRCDVIYKYGVYDMIELIFYDKNGNESYANSNDVRMLSKKKDFNEGKVEQDSSSTFHYLYQCGTRMGMQCKQIVHRSCVSMYEQYMMPNITPLLGTGTHSGSLYAISQTIQPKLVMLLEMYRLVFYYNYKYFTPAEQILGLRILSLHRGSFRSNSVMNSLLYLHTIKYAIYIVKYIVLFVLELKRQYHLLKLEQENNAHGSMYRKQHASSDANKVIARSTTMKCLICLEGVCQPTVTPCGHVFCWACIVHWFDSIHCHDMDDCTNVTKKVHKCPLCRYGVTLSSLRRLYNF